LWIQEKRANSCPISTYHTETWVKHRVTMSSSATEQFTAHILCLDPEGANWANFAMRFKGAMITSRCWGYFDGSKKLPAPADKDKP
jgi:hypothetical protein